jgi:hypothetical protein
MKQMLPTNFFIVRLSLIKSNLNPFTSQLLFTCTLTKRYLFPIKFYVCDSLSQTWIIDSLGDKWMQPSLWAIFEDLQRGRQIIKMIPVLFVNQTWILLRASQMWWPLHYVKSRFSEKKVWIIYIFIGRWHGRVG